MASEQTVDEAIQVHAWLDIACPWCWVAKRRFEEAIAEFGRPVEVEYHSWELAPDLPAGTVITESEMLQRLHDINADEADQRIRLVTSTAARLGLSYDFSKVQHTNTFLAHQLLQHAKVKGLQDHLLEALLSAFFEQGRHVGQLDELVTIAESVGLSPAEARAVLTDGRYAPAVRADRRWADSHGITNIPTYLLPGEPPIHGAKRPRVFLEALRRAAE